MSTGLRMRHTGHGMLELFIGDAQYREIGITPGWQFKDRDEVIARYNEHKELKDALSAALSLSEDEREIVSRIAALPSVAKGFEPDAYIGLTVIELDTLRALIARFTNIGEVK